MYSYNRVFTALEMDDEESKTLALRALELKPERDDKTAEYFYDIHGYHPSVEANFETRLDVEEVHHAWSYLELLERYSTISPGNKVVGDAIKKLDEALSKSNYSGFDSDKFEGIKTRYEGHKSK